MSIVDQVAAAIVAAAREVAPDDWQAVAIAIASREKSRGGPNGNLRMTRARAYAAFAVRSVTGCSSLSAGRMVGASSVDAYLSNIDCKIKRGDLPWWRPAKLERVIAATRAAGGEPDEPEPMDVTPFLPTPPPAPVAPRERPAESPRQIEARRMLEEAARNTARLPVE